MDATTSTAATQPEPALANAHRESIGSSSVLGAALAVLVGVAVFWILLRIRRVFGLK